MIDDKKIKKDREFSEGKLSNKEWMVQFNNDVKPINKKPNIFIFMFMFIINLIDSFFKFLTKIYIRNEGAAWGLWMCSAFVLVLISIVLDLSNCKLTIKVLWIIWAQFLSLAIITLIYSILKAFLLFIWKSLKHTWIKTKDVFEDCEND